MRRIFCSAWSPGSRPARVAPIPPGQAGAPAPAGQRGQARAAGDPGQDRGHHERADRRQRARQALADPRHPEGRERARDGRAREAAGPGVLPRVPARRAAHRQPRGRGRRADHRQRRHRAQPRRRGPRRLARSSTTRASSPTTPTASTRRSPGAAWCRSATTSRRCRTRCGSRPTAATARPCRALGYVKQDQATLSKHAQRRPTSRAEPAEVYVEAPAKLEFDKAQWVERLKRCSAKALKGAATRGTCGVVFQLNTAYFVNSEGSADPAVVDERAAVGLGRRQGRRRHEPVAARAAVRPHAGDLPGDAEVDKMIATVTGDLDALHDAPLADPYVGPAILEGRAAGVFFHEVFGHRIEGHRQKDTTSGQTFASYVGKDIAPEWLSRLRRSADRHAQRHPAQRLLPVRRRGRARAPRPARSTTASSSAS